MIMTPAAALVQLREENSARSDLMQGYLDCWRNDKDRAERAEAEVARLTTKCKYGDPMCPCQDGDACHYEGDNPMTPPPIAALKSRIAALEAERDALKQDAVWLLQRALAIINRWQELYGEHQPQFLPPAHQIEWAEDASEFIDAAREKP